MMNHDEMIAVIAAHRDGKKIEVRHKGMPSFKWEAVSYGPSWNFYDFEYRVAPEPLELWVVVDHQGHIGSVFTDKKTAEQCSSMKLTHFRQVTE